MQERRRFWLLQWCTSWLLGWMALLGFIVMGVISYVFYLPGWEPVVRLSAEWCFGVFGAWLTFLIRNRHRPGALFNRVRYALFVGLCAACGTALATLIQRVYGTSEAVFFWFAAAFDMVISLARMAILAQVGHGITAFSTTRTQTTRWKASLTICAALAVAATGAICLYFATVWIFNPAQAPGWFQGQIIITSLFQALSVGLQSLVNLVFERRDQPAPFGVLLLRWARDYLETAPIAILCYLLGNTTGLYLGNMTKDSQLVQLFWQQLFGQIGRQFRVVVLADTQGHTWRDNARLILQAIWDVVRDHPDPLAHRPVAPQGTPEALTRELLAVERRILTYYAQVLPLSVVTGTLSDALTSLTPASSAALKTPQAQSQSVPSTIAPARLTMRRLTRRERVLLKMVARHASSRFTRRRVRILLLYADGERASAIAQLLGCSAATVRRAVHAFNQRGLNALVKAPAAKASSPM